MTWLQVPPGPSPSGKAEPQVWVRPTSDGGAAVALFNGNDVFSANITITFADVPTRGWSSSTQLAVRDMWEKQDMVSDACLWTRTHAHTRNSHTHTQAHIHTYTQAHTHSGRHTHTHTQAHVHACAHAHTHTHTHQIKKHHAHFFLRCFVCVLFLSTGNVDGEPHSYCPPALHRSPQAQAFL